jgi:hypothetical protein
MLLDWDDMLRGLKLSLLAWRATNVGNVSMLDMHAYMYFLRPGKIRNWFMLKRDGVCV